MSNKRGRTHCLHGHEWTDENTYVTSAGYGACRLCHKAANRKQDRAARSRYADYGRKAHLRKRYGLSLEGFQALLDGQGGRCAVCGTAEPGGRGTWHVDHDHGCCPGQNTCGECIRGILCNGCNRGLGFMQDDPRRLEAAAQYLREAISISE